MTRIATSIFIKRVTLLLVGLILVIAFRSDTGAVFEGECTIGMIRGEATLDGRPILWKNRDVTNSAQALHYGGGNDEYRFVGIGYAGDSNRVYGGVNEVGFAIANSTSYNLGAGNTQSQFDDGDVMTTALLTCSTLHQLRDLLDSTNTLYGGRTSPANFFAFDSTGEMAIFEAGRSTWQEVPIHSTSRYAVRANFSYSGDTNLTGTQQGKSRHDRARTLISRLVEDGPVRIDSILHVARDIAPETYTIPNYLYSPDEENLYLDNTICRAFTMSSIVILGGKNGPNGWIPPMMLLSLGRPFASAPVPVWPHQTAFSGSLTDRVLPAATICQLSNQLFRSVAPTTRIVPTAEYNRVNNRTLTVEREVLAQISPYFNEPMTPMFANELSDSIAQRVALALQSVASGAVQNEVVPVSYQLSDPYPNPFNSSTAMSLTISDRSTMQMRVFNMVGKEVYSTPEKLLNVGSHSIQWNSKGMPSGVYWIGINLNHRSEWRKVVVVR